MDTITDSFAPGVSFSPPLSHRGGPESVNSPPHATEQRVNLQLQEWDVSTGSAESQVQTSTSPYSNELETDRNDDACEKMARERMIEKWRSIKIADKNRARKKIYRTHDVHTALFGQNYSKVYEAFQQGISSPEARQTVPISVPAKRYSDAVPRQASKRRRQDERASPPQSDQLQAPAISAESSAAAPITQALTGPEPGEYASPSSEAEEGSSIRPRPRSYSATKEQPSRRKGVGLYAGNWEYVTDEEKVPEYLTVAEKIADVEGRTTRRAFARLTSKESARDSNKLIRSSFKNQVRKSGRARNSINYAVLSTSEDNANGVATPEQTQYNDISPAHLINQISSSMSASSSSDRSTMMPDERSRSSSTSTAINLEQLERPKLSWNAIVYEVLATAEGPLTFTQLTQEIKDRYPFFNASSQDKVLKSGLKNPLYFHEAFCKGEIINGKQTWGLKPGEFVDKKTGEVLTPQPRNPIIPPGRTKQASETEVPSSVELTSKVSPSHHPRSSNPRFGREILNSPEIPDSQDVAPTTSSPQEAGNRIAAERPLQLKEPTGAHKYAENATTDSAIVLPESNVPVQSPQAGSQWAVVTGGFVNTASNREVPIAARADDQNIRKLVSPIDREASAIADHSVSPLQAAEPRAPSIPSSIGESGNHNSPTTSQYESTPTSLQHGVSPTSVSTLLRDDAATSQTPHIVPATPMPSATPFGYTHLDGIVPDGKAGTKENIYMHMQRQRWA